MEGPVSIPLTYPHPQSDSQWLRCDLRVQSSPYFCVLEVVAVVVLQTQAFSVERRLLGTRMRSVLSRAAFRQQRTRGLVVCVTHPNTQEAEAR